MPGVVEVQGANEGSVETVSDAACAPPNDERKGYKSENKSRRGCFRVSHVHTITRKQYDRTMQFYFQQT